jgi:hypothetical protein
MKFVAFDQYGQVYKLKTTHPRKELMELLGASSAQKMYRDTKSGESYHAGYIIRGHWIEVLATTPIGKVVQSV